jgi:acetyl-CoA carboxylase biotin carboxylase subunit
MIKRLLIANRGEIAVRIIRACGEMGIESIAVYSEADAKAPHVAAADCAIAIGPAPAHASYMSVAKLIDAARASGADAIHPGYGFLSENAAFASACAGAGLIFVGPPADVISRMGSKIEARRIVSAAGVPVVPGETPGDQSDRGIRQAIDRIGLPAIIKASAGGGGKGMRLVLEAGAIDESMHAARREATAAFGDGTLYVERLVAHPRHVEVQIVADDHGHVVHMFERDCSTQRRHQKVIEESPSPAVTSALRGRLTEAAVMVARAANYRNVGTIEFLVDLDGGPDEAPFYFLEMNTRLQVEHPVTEQVTGLDLVRTQLLVANGEPLTWTQPEVSRRGHAIEARLYAEDPAQGFLPQAGRLTRYREPRRPGVRVDSGVVEGGDVSIYYDPMIAKVIATAATRDMAIARLCAALREFEIAGIRTNRSFLLRILESAAFRDGAIDTAFLDREGAAIAAEPAVVSRQSSVVSRQSSVVSRQSSVRSRQSSVVSPQSSVVSQQSSVVSQQSSVPNPQFDYDPWASGAPTVRAQFAPASVRRAATSAARALTAPMPATVIAVQVKAGDSVKKGDVVVVLEAMKMELPIRALGNGVVSAVRCREGELVQADATLVEFT